jgi:23S rRNA (adenine2503-C2)-methyltransferase
LLEQTGVDPSKIQKLQIMFMSMGEPILNYKNLQPALYGLNEKYPQARLLISTSAPRNFDAFRSLIRDSVLIDTVGLQFSVHESSDEARAKLIPSPTMTLKEMSQVGNAWAFMTGRRPFFNYCVHANNNTVLDVQRLKHWFDPSVWEATLSVICERDEHVAAANARQRQLTSDFMDLMVGAGFSTRMFDPAGQDDIGGGCGQLWFVQDWMKKNPKLAKPSRGNGLPVVHTPRVESTTEGVAAAAHEVIQANPTLCCSSGV